MMDYIILFSLIVEVCILIKSENIIYGTWITPISLLALPYTFIVMIAFLFAPALGFVSFYAESALVWMVGLFLFWLGGLTISLTHGKTIRDSAKKNPSILYEIESEKVVLILAWITILVMSYGLLVSIESLGLDQIGTEDFSLAYGSGWVGHFRTFSIGLTIFLIGTVETKKLFPMITIIILMFFYLMYPVKSWVFMPLIGGVIYRLLSRRSKLSIYKPIYYLLIAFILFDMVYMVKIGVFNTEKLFDYQIHKFLLLHFTTYIFAGVLAIGNIVKEGINNINSEPNFIIAPFINLYYVITSGQLVIPISEHFSVISVDGVKISNVHTLFGTILINMGYFQSIIFDFCLGSFVYVIFIFANISRNCGVIIIWSFIGAMLSLGFFDYYFATLPAVELPVYYAIFGFLLSRQGLHYNRSKYQDKSLEVNPT